MLMTQCKSRVSQNFQILVPKTKDFEFQIFSFLKFPPTVPSLATLVLVLVLVLATLSPWPPPPPNCWPWSEPALAPQLQPDSALFAFTQKICQPDQKISPQRSFFHLTDNIHENWNSSPSRLQPVDSSLPFITT